MANNSRVYGVTYKNHYLKFVDIDFNDAQVTFIECMTMVKNCDCLVFF